MASSLCVPVSSTHIAGTARKHVTGTCDVPAIAAQLHGLPDEISVPKRRVRPDRTHNKSRVICHNSAIADPDLHDGLDSRSSSTYSARQTIGKHTCQQQPVETQVQPNSKRNRLGECGYSTEFSMHYSLTSALPLGQGQYGVVYQAQHRTSGRQVAVKVVSKERLDRTRQQHLHYIQQEIALWQACQPCPHVVRLEGVYEDERCVYMVQQLCSGGDLRSVLQGGMLTEHDAAVIMHAVLQVIRQCHDQHHVYGDCKPANFLLLHPHKSTGCQQHPQLSSTDVTIGIDSQSDPVVTRTIHEHVLSSLDIASSGDSFDNRYKSASGTGTASDAMNASTTDGTQAAIQDVPEWISVLSHSTRLPSEQVTFSSAGMLDVRVREICGTVCSDQLVVLATDFGCCQPLHLAHQRGTTTSKRIGSPVYMAPEMWQAGGLIGTGVDVWAAGVMLYQLISGRYPFWSTTAQVIDAGGMQLWQLVCGVQSNPVKLLGDTWDKVSPACKHLLAAMLERDPTTRISAHDALQHPWFKNQLGKGASSSSHIHSAQHVSGCSIKESLSHCTT